MKTRSAQSSDVQAIAKAHVVGWQHAYSGILPSEFLAELSIEQRARMWADAIEKQTQRVLVIEVAGEFAGFAAFGLCRDAGAQATDFEVWAIYLNPGVVGTGVGRALWLRTLREMKLAGAARVALWVLAKNERAIRFYRVAGFTEDVGSRKSIQIGGVSVDEVRYVRQLAG
jgi:GNAT superfamily N-acetyltransferase